MPDTSLFDQAIARIDSVNSEDPQHELVEGQPLAAAVLYGRRMTQWLCRFAPQASEPLRLAARAQHIRRWQIPRSSYPMTRGGYHQWRTALYSFHAQTASALLREVGYDDQTIERVASLLRKENLKSDPEMQTLEDVICLVFLENYFIDFARERDPEKIITILRKTWNKMSPAGRAQAAELPLSDAAKALVQKALALP